ncbi:DNA excision repair protein ERCC-6-like [Danio aesculapii]|uniref:DNA excision repair protein ERCC-6-like n=1 Tax=Danio aesculapii TaxID=1142201 RepID=UPI0024C0B3A4|nr:DNA excision repair protein ERCC-6-like [Danio aesculapii]
MESNNVEEVTDKFGGCLSLDTEKMEKYDRYRQKGKEAAINGELPRALELFQLAYQLQPSEKLKKRVQAIQELIQREEEDEEEEEEFVNVNDSGLKLYKGLYDKLYDHQKEGVAFLYSLYRDGRKGGILADDMGLGKTIQVISFLSGMYDAELANHTLLVMPTSLIKNWVREFAKWTPGMRVKEFHGSSKAERNRNLERIQRKGGVIITTYQMLINNYEQLGSYGQREFKWDYVILDEAHKIKTSSTKTAKSAHAIPAKNRVLLTGTPVQNNLREMWALFDFACQGSLLGTSKTFKTEYENPITRAREKDATPGEKALGLRISQNLTDIIKPYFLRRTKADVQQKKQKLEECFEDEENQENKCPNVREGVEMPSLTRKNDLIVWTYLSSVQEDIYNKFISLDQIKELLTTTKSPLAELTVLKKLCDHPRLLSQRAVIQLGLERGSASELVHSDESESAVSQIDNISDQTLIEESGKLQFVVSLMECLREEGHRTLIFSQSRKMLDIMERVLRNRNFRLLRLDGTVTQLAEREKRISLFQTDKRYTIFLLTTQVGGVGITLTAANRVVIFDPSWNPATDAQAVDRAYRIGQTENVLIYRLITCGTVEERIYRRQVFKDSLIRQTTGDKKNPFRYFSKQELRELFKLEDTRSSSTQQQLQAMHAQSRRSDTSLDHHIARLHSMEMFGISDHDLMFTKEPAADEDDPEDAEAHHYIQTRVQKAQELMQAESELHGQLLESMAQNTEPAWLRQMGQPNSSGRDRPAPPRIKNEPVTVDLTHNSFDEPEFEEDEQNVPSAEDAEMETASEDVEVIGEDLRDKVIGSEVEVVGEEVEDVAEVEVVSEDVEDVGVEVEDAGEVEVVSEEGQVQPKSPRSGGEWNLQIVKTEVSPIAEKFADVITLDDTSDEADSSDFNTESKQQNSLHSLQSPSHQFPKLDDLSRASNTLDKGEVEPEKRHSHVLSSPPSPHEATAGEPFKAEMEIPHGNFNLLLEDSADMYFSEDEEVHEVEESVAEESPEFQLQMDVSGERLEEPSINHGKQNNEEFFNYNHGEVSKHESLLKIRSTPNASVDDSFVHSVRRKKRQVISDTEEEEEEEEESEKPCLTSSPFVNTLSRLGSSTPKATLVDGARLRRSLNASVASRRSFVVSLLENESDEESNEDKTKSSGASETCADELVEEVETSSGNKSKSYETSEANGTLADELVEEEGEYSGGKNTSDKDSESNETRSKEFAEEEKPSGDKSQSYEISEANETHADELVEEEEHGEEKIESYEISEASETHADDSEEELIGDHRESYKISESSEADESVVEEEEPSGETLNTEESEMGEEEERAELIADQEQEEWQSAVLESTGDVELDSNETMDQCAPKTVPLETRILPVCSTNTAAEASENKYKLLVLSGKQSLAEGRKQEALDFFLKAIDINTGDPEIQLLIIQLYRQLSQ